MKLTSDPRWSPSCRNCNNHPLVPILDLGMQGWCNDFITNEQIGKEPTYSLKLNYCKECDMLQLTTTVPKERMFKHHDYLSGTTKTLREHFYNIAKENIDQFKLSGKDIVLDIGGNDGTQLAQYKILGLSNLINVESADNIAKLSSAAGIYTINDFFNDKLAYNNFNPGEIQLINAAGVFFHLEELHSVIRAIKYLLARNGIFVVQFMYAGMMIEKGTYDMIYHEHLLYYTLHSLENLLNPYGLKVFDAYESDIHSGSVIAKLCHSSANMEPTKRYLNLKEKDKEYTFEKFKKFGQKIVSDRYRLRKFIKDLKGESKKIYGYGAPAKGNTLLTYEKIDNKLLDKLVEINPLKIGKYTPVTHIPIVQESKEDLPDYYLLLAHNFDKEILEKNKEITDKGVKFIVPFPTPRIIP
jgi:hypothetical protein